MFHMGKENTVPSLELEARVANKVNWGKCFKELETLTNQSEWSIRSNIVLLRDAISPVLDNCLDTLGN